MARAAGAATDPGWSADHLGRPTGTHIPDVARECSYPQSDRRGLWRASAHRGQLLTEDAGATNDLGQEREREGSTSVSAYDEAREWLSRKDMRKVWDDQITSNRSASWRSAHMIASKMERCRNNPRNGGTGHGECPYYIDDDGDPRREAADNRMGGMRRRWR
jgi:hypothetical protein